MKTFVACAIIFGYLTPIESYSKYGRTCKDIGCTSSEVCVMETDPCSYYQRDNECGSYPTCKKVSAGLQSCSNYVCPPSTVCKMDGTTPKCVTDSGSVGYVGYNTQSRQDPGAVQPQHVYPSLPKGETTPRPNVYRPGYQNGGAGYQGGQIGSGYPGQPGQQRPQYPQQQGQYPGQNPYQPQGQYPQQYPQQYPGGYPSQGQGGYPAQGQGGYSGRPNYNQGGYHPGGQGGYGSNPYGDRYGNKNSASSILVDKLTDTLKSYGTDLLKNALGRIKLNNNN